MLHQAIYRSMFGRTLALISTIWSGPFIDDGSMDKGSAEAVITRLGRWLHAKNYLAAADGNFSVRIDSGTFWISASGVHKGFQEVCPVARVGISGEILEGHPSSETALHRAVYEKASLARCVIHAHPPMAIAWSMARPELRELDCSGFSEVILALGSIPIAKYARPGGGDLAASIQSFLPQHRAVILGRHGALSWGESVEEALNGIERMEHAALILGHAEMLGGAKGLPESEIEWLKNRRLEMGGRTL